MNAHLQNPAAVRRPLPSTCVAAAVAFALSGCLATTPETGGSKTAVTGAAGGATAEGASSSLEKCNQTLGTLGLVEDQNATWYQTLRSYQLGSTIPVLRIMIQQSNCFVIVERGGAMQNMNTERALQQSGEMRANSNFGKGQMVSADYTMSPNITFSQNTGGGGAALGGFSPALGLFSAVAGSMKTNEASTTLIMIDNRSGVQLAAAEGSAKNMDFNVGAAFFGGFAGGGASGYSNSPEGKIIIAAFTDSYNQLVKAVRNYKAQVVKGGLGTGGTLGVQGGSTAASQEIEPVSTKSPTKTATKNTSKAKPKVADKTPQ